VHKGGAVFDIEKLKWFNHEHLKRLSDREYAARVGTDEKFVPLLKERAKTLVEAKELLKEFEYAAPSKELLIEKANADAVSIKAHLENVKEMLANTHEPFTKESIHENVFGYASEQGRAAVLWPLRVALSGKDKSPDPFTLAALLGKEESLSRIEEAIKKL
jgi:glutamyl/glutaminyl-tRNA synthetase